MTHDAASLHPETLAVHAGWRHAPGTNAVAVPIYQTAAYQFDSTDHAANLFQLAEPGNIYTRLMNPTNDVLEQRLAALDGGAAALALSAGQAASALCVMNLCQAGDNFVCSTDIYGGTWNLFNNTLKGLGIECRFVDPTDPEAFVRASDDRTRLYYGESLPNPKLNVFPIAEVAALGRDRGIPLVVDNTSAPVLCRPLDHGAAVVMYSATKYLGGHGTSLGGVVVDGGTFDWAGHAARFPTLNAPDGSYHGLKWTEAAGAIAFALRMRAVLLRDLGPALSPFNAFQILQGVETVPLRMRAHADNATRVAAFLKDHPKVTRVAHPSLQDGEARRRADAYLSGGYGGLVGFELAGGVAAGRRFIDALQLFYHVANIGDARSLAIHPASTTHQQLKPEERAAAGVSEGYVRLSLGIEHPDDLLADLTQALDQA